MIATTKGSCVVSAFFIVNKGIGQAPTGLCEGLRFCGLVEFESRLPTSYTSKLEFVRFLKGLPPVNN